MSKLSINSLTCEFASDGQCVSSVVIVIHAATPGQGKLAAAACKFFTALLQHCAISNVYAVSACSVYGKALHIRLPTNQVLLHHFLYSLSLCVQGRSTDVWVEITDSLALLASDTGTGVVPPTHKLLRGTAGIIDRRPNVKGRANKHYRRAGM